MEELELFDRAMNVGYNMLLGKDKPFKPNDSDELEDMIQTIWMNSTGSGNSARTMPESTPA